MSTYCPLPWIFQAVRNNGDLRVCCQANVSPGQGLLKKENGEVYSMANMTLSEIGEARNSTLLKEMRTQMLVGEWPESCVRCKTEEASKLRSRREYENANWEKDFSESWARQNTKKDGAIQIEEVPVVSFDIRPGNKCNLKCRMCGPTDSDMWYEDHNSLYGDSFRDTHGKVILSKNKNKWVANSDNYLWHERDEFWEYLKLQAKNIQHLHIVGGEPLLIENHYRLLEYLVESKFASGILLEYNTNLMLLPERALNLWKNFKRVRIGVSIDAHGKLNDYIRSPSRWEAIEKNLHRLQEGPENLDLWISATIQIYNVFQITDLIRWKLESGLTRFNKSQNLPFITSHMLHNPKHLNIRALPPHLKESVKQHYSKFLQWFDEWSESNIENLELRQKRRQQLKKLLNSYETYMEAKDESAHYPEFISYTQNLDKIRNQNHYSVVPEFNLHA